MHGCYLYTCKISNISFELAGAFTPQVPVSSMKLGRLLEFHQQQPANIGLPKNLGDNFLINNNKLYRSIRTQATQFGFKYTDTIDNKYLALPLSQLEAVLRTKTIPYVDNVSVLLDMETQVKHTATWDDVTDNLKKNHVFHESCHAIARTISDSIFKNGSSPNETILRLLLEESFSNSCELLGIIDADDTAHRIFYELNSFIFMYEDRSQLKKLVAEAGYPDSIKFLIGCYLFSNFLHEKITESDFTSLLKLLKLQNHSTSVIKTFRSVSKTAFELNPRFRQVTTIFYLRLNGISLTMEGLNKIDFLQLMTRDPRFLSLINALSQTS